MKKYSWKNKLYNLLSCILFFALWEAISIWINNEIYIPRIEIVANSLVEILIENNFLKIIASTLLRALISYAAALGLAILLGVLSYTYPFFSFLFAPLNSLFKTIPTLVLVVLALVWFNKDSAPFIVSFAIVMPILYEGIKNTLKEIDHNIIEMAEIYEVNFKDRLLKIYLPQIKFYLINIFISTFSLAFKVVIAGEVHGQPKYGMGSSIQIEKMNFNTAGIFAWISVIVILSFAFDGLNILIKRRIYRWKKSGD